MGLNPVTNSEFCSITCENFVGYISLSYRTQELALKTPFNKKKTQEANKLTDFPLTHSVARELDAMADPHPKVLNLASTILPFSSTLI